MTAPQRNAYPIEKGETPGKGGQVLRNDGPSNFNHRKFLRLRTGEMAEVLLHLTARPNIVQELCYRFLVMVA